jgi:hypothetical protein
LEGEELVADGSEKSFDFAFGGAIAHGGVMEQTGFRA